MMQAVVTPGGQSRPALAAALTCYFLWGVMPLLFIGMGKAGASPVEILAQRALWSAPWAGLMVLIAGQGSQVLKVLRTPKTLVLLLLTAVLISTNWAVFVWAVNNERNIEASLGYYINPLFNMAVGVFIFKERINRLGLIAIGLAGIGVVLQAIALGHPPYVSLVLALSFCAYGIIRKQVDAEAQTGLFVECLFMTLPALAFAIWMYVHGQGLMGHGLGKSLLMMLAGPATVVPLALFAWSARRLDFSAVGFLQFIGPTMGFMIGVWMGEDVSLYRMLSFVFIWSGAAVFTYGAWKTSRHLRQT